MGQIMTWEVPQQSEIANRLVGATFYDCHAVAVPVEGYADKSALSYYLDIVGKTPGWVGVLMTLRNRVVSLLGLKNLGHLGDVDAGKMPAGYVVGDRLGIFDVRYLSHDEVILGDTDKHLAVQVSLCKVEQQGQPHVVISTVVHNRNLLGRVYMVFVAPVHRKIVPAMLRRL